MSEGPEGWWLQRVTYRGEDVTDVPTEFRSSAPGEVDLHVVFTNRAAQVNRIAMPNDRRVFTLPGLVGDRYAIVAFEPNGQDASSSLFKRLMPVATPISLTAGESRVIDLKVIVLPPQ